MTGDSTRYRDLEVDHRSSLRIGEGGDPVGGPLEQRQGLGIGLVGGAFELVPTEDQRLTRLEIVELLGQRAKLRFPTGADPLDDLGGSLQSGGIDRVAPNAAYLFRCQAFHGFSSRATMVEPSRRFTLSARWSSSLTAASSATPRAARVVRVK